MNCWRCALPVAPTEPVRLDHRYLEGPVALHVACATGRGFGKPWRVFDCATCGRRVECATRNKAFCSPACGAERQHRRNARLTWLEDCLMCHAPLTGRLDRKTCSGPCRVALHRWRLKVRSERTLVA